MRLFFRAAISRGKDVVLTDVKGEYQVINDQQDFGWNGTFDLPSATQTIPTTTYLLTLEDGRSASILVLARPHSLGEAALVPFVGVGLPPR
jgi:hypothetical protein